MLRFLAAAALVLVIAGGAVYAFFAADLDRARQRLDGRSEIVATSFGPVEVAETGSGTPVLVIHGSGGGFDQGLDMTAPLAGYGYRLIAPSRFGYLRSAMPANATPELQADALAELLAQRGEAKVVVFGGSAGALSAMQFAIRHPDRCQALVLMVPAAYAPDRARDENGAANPFQQWLMLRAIRSDFIMWAGTKLAPSMMTTLLLATPPEVVAAASEAEKARVAGVLQNILPISDRADGLLFDTATAGHPPEYRLDQIRCPVMAISAEDDLYGTAAAAKYIADKVPGAWLLVYPRGGHVLVGHQEEVWREIDGFLRRQVAPSAPAARDPVAAR